MDELTNWHSGDVKPVHEGVYERRHNDGDYYSYFHDGEWGISATYSMDGNYVATAYRMGGSSMFQKLLWRGLANKPTGKSK